MVHRMKLARVFLSRFRAYSEDTWLDAGNLTALIGRNDSGKSSILEALAIFFNSEAVTLEKDDLCVHSHGREIRIGCVFSDFPEQVVLDADARTTLMDEHLLNAEGQLEIIKVFDCSLQKLKESTFARALHPTADGLSDLLLLKNADLKKRLEERGVGRDGIDLRSNPSIRRALWAASGDLREQIGEVPLDQNDAKKIWDALKPLLPMYAFFRADRPSRDDDAEVQDPMKLAVQQAIRDAEQELGRVKALVQQSAMDVATRTLEKLREMDPALANELSPQFRSEPKWEQLFKLSLTGDDQIPVNKRGSGVRRLIVLNFFRAAADRRQATAGSPGIIYGIEEPETSQHPAAQKMLIDALVDLSERDGTQVLLTTHVPGLAGLLPVGSLRYISRTVSPPRVAVRACCDDTYDQIATDLGVIPDSRVRLLIYVEGPHDVQFLKRLSHRLSMEDLTIPNLMDDPRVAFVPTGGSSLKEWVDSRHLAGLGKPELHLYDKETPDETPARQATCEAVNTRGNRDFAKLTDKRAMENYLHPDAVHEALGVRVAFGDEDNVAEIVGQAVGRNQRNAKHLLNRNVVDRMTLERLRERDPADELLAWLRRVPGYF